jgi:hypothetical protein
MPAANRSTYKTERFVELTVTDVWKDRVTLGNPVTYVRGKKINGVVSLLHLYTFLACIRTILLTKVEKLLQNYKHSSEMDKGHKFRTYD